MIQEKMKFDRALGTSELGPGKKRKTKGYGGTVHGQELVLEAEFLVLSWSHCSANLKGFIA